MVSSWDRRLEEFKISLDCGEFFIGLPGTAQEIIANGYKQEMFYILPSAKTHGMLKSLMIQERIDGEVIAHFIRIGIEIHSPERQCLLHSVVSEKVLNVADFYGFSRCHSMEAATG